MFPDLSIRRTSRRGGDPATCLRQKASRFSNFPCGPRWRGAPSDWPTTPSKEVLRAIPGPVRGEQLPTQITRKRQTQAAGAFAKLFGHFVWDIEVKKRHAIDLPAMRQG